MGRGRIQLTAPAPAKPGHNRRPLTPAERQAARRRRLDAAGIVEVRLRVPAAAAPFLRLAARILNGRDAKHLRAAARLARTLTNLAVEELRENPPAQTTPARGREDPRLDPWTLYRQLTRKGKGR